MLEAPARLDWVVVTPNPIPMSEAAAWVTTPASGAVVTFAGVVRDHSEGRPGVTAMTYEAYEEVAQDKLADVVREARERYEGIERLAVWHRTGRLELSEVSVVVAVSAAHRDEAFTAARFVIDTLKETVPIWKREHWEAGEDWAEATMPISAVPTANQGRSS